VKDWPAVTALICGSAGEPATAHTRASLAASDYAGVLEVVSDTAGDGSSPAGIANRLASTASGTYLLMLAAGTTLDPHCVQLLVARAEMEDEPAIVAPHRRGTDGRPVTGHGFFSAPRKVIDALPDDRLPHNLIGMSAMLIRAAAFRTSGGFDLDLIGSTILSAELASRVLTAPGPIGRATRAVTFEPGSGSDLHRRPGYLLAPPEAIVREAPEPPPDRPHRLLWIAPHLPDRRRSGVDARHLEMMRALQGRGTQVVVFSAHGTHDAATELRLDALGISRFTPPPEERWDLDMDREHHLEDLLAARRWDSIFVSHPHMAAGIRPIIRRRAGDARTIVDLATVRFPAAHDAAAGPLDVDKPRVAQELAALAGADGVVTATEPDRRVIELGEPTLPAFVWTALGDEVEAGAGGARDGSLLYLGDLFHHPNAQGIEWWLDAVAARVEARMGRPVPLRVVGTGSEIYRAIWQHPRKIHLAGWQPDLGLELAGARLLAIPLTYATGTGGRMATALASGLPIAASAAAAALLPRRLADLVHVGSTPAELAKAIADLLTDDAHWEDARAHILEADLPAQRAAQANGFVDWLASIQPRQDRDAAGVPSRSSGSRRGRRRLNRAS
jgi:glycosyltransferase involved in cell wall biosynthesis